MKDNNSGEGRSRRDGSRDSRGSGDARSSGRGSGRQDGGRPASRGSRPGESSGGTRDNARGGYRGDRSGSGRPSADRPGGEGRREEKSRYDKPRDGKPSYDRSRDDRPRGDRSRDDRSSRRDGSGPRRDDRAGRGGSDRPRDDAAPFERRRTDEEQAIYDGPPLPDHITGEELDRGVAQQLRGLPDRLAQRVARHLAAAGFFVDSDPETAYQHALAARARASRLAVIREAAGETAYAAGHYAEALAELRAAKRMNGATAYLPIMADCHRALGKPEQALKLARSEGVANFSPEAKAEMTIVEAGARVDMGQLDAALRTLEVAPLTTSTRAPWVVRLRYAYADTLERAGRTADALAWFHRAHAIDAYDVTDAAARAAALEAAGE